MKRTVLSGAIILMLMVGLIVLTACGNTEKGNEVSTTGGNEEQYDEFKIYDKTLKLDYKNDFKKMTYMTNYEELLPGGGGENSVELKYEDDTKVDDIIVDYGATVVRVEIRYFDGKTIDEVMSQAPYERTNKTVGDLDYEYFEYTNNGVNGYVYCYNHDGSTYTISFDAKIDITSLIDAFMKNVSFN